MKKIIEIENFLSDEHFENVCSLFEKVNWKYSLDCSFVDDSIKKTTYFDESLDSNFYSHLSENFLEEYELYIRNHKIKNLINVDHVCRSFLNIFLKRNQQKITCPHVNLQIDHLVALLYMNDCDGQTIFYNQTKDDIPFDTLLKYGKNIKDHYNFTVRKKITPQKNKMVIFDGSIYHAPETPSKGNRYTVTTDFIGSFKNDNFIRL